MKKYQINKGQKFNYLQYIKDLPPYREPNNIWKRRAEFLCECGKITIKLVSLVRNGSTKSCGCYNRNLTIRRNHENIVHGMTGTRFAKIYDGMKGRCRRPNDPNFNNYGARGIKVCWKSLAQFKKDMFDSYCQHVKTYGEKQTTIDRINNNGDYSFSNCRWSSQEEQQYNKRNTFLIEYQGKPCTLLELEKISGIKRRLIYKRLYEAKWPLEKTLSTPPRKMNAGCL